ncbi:hypothetical protein MED193_09630 [Roseobacter sp. MED193]|nr:hypothetical protein MED193_09630 [Roseobacter sp. MED193]
MVFSLQSQPRWLAVDGLQSDAPPLLRPSGKKGKNCAMATAIASFYFILDPIYNIFSLSTSPRQQIRLITR